MADEYSGNNDHMVSNSFRRKKKNIRVFVRRKRLSSGISHKPNLPHSKSIEELTSIIKKSLKTSKKNIIVVNYKPVFVKSRLQKSNDSKLVQTNETFPSTNHNNRRGSITTTPSSNNSSFHNKPKNTSNPSSVSFDVPDVEDPLMFIEMMYQQLFTEDGQLRSETEPEVLANYVKQIVTHSRRNSIAQRRDSVQTNIHQQHRPSTSLSSSSRVIPNIFSEEEEDPNILSQRSRTTTASRRSSKRSSINNIDQHQRQLHTFLSSYYHHQRRTSTNPTYPFSVDDTDNEDLDTFSDFNSYRKTIRTSPPPSIDEDITVTDSKLLSSSGYQSLKSPQPIISKVNSENDHHYCPNCTQTSQVVVVSSTSALNIIQPVREMFMKYLNFILISKNILLVPLFIFLLRQRPMHIGN